MCNDLRSKIVIRSGQFAVLGDLKIECVGIDNSVSFELLVNDSGDLIVSKFIDRIGSFDENINHDTI